MLEQNNHIIDTVILKVVAPCNLNCSYCYEYNMGDDSWKFKPKRISHDMIELICNEIQRYINANNLKNFSVTLHGGEPLMLSEKNLENLLFRISKIKVDNLKIGMQTNATLANINKIKILNNYKVNIGVSVDGNEKANKYRVDLKGNSAHERIVKGIELIKKEAKYFSGFLSVVNLNTEPSDVLDFLSKYEPYQIDLLQPFANYNNPPIPSKTKYKFGDWMIKAFTYWNENKRLSKIKIRYFEDAIFSIIKNESRSDWFGLKPPGYVIVATDGNYEGLDTLKVADKSVRVTEKNVINSSIDDFIMSEANKIRLGGLSMLPDDCKNCQIKKWCSGGYLPTRFSSENGYNNRSYYCSDLKNLFDHINIWIQKNHNRNETRL